MHLYASKGLDSLRQLGEWKGLLWRCTEAYDHHVDLARNHRRAPLKSLGVS